jgi:hypothetical protein
MNTIVDGTTLFNTDHIKYPPMKVLTNGGKIMNVRNSKTNNALRFSTPLMLTWGASDYEGNEKFELSLQFPNTDNQTEATSNFLRNMTAFENQIKADAIANSKEWLGKAKISPDVLDAMWTPMLKYPKDKETGEFDLTRDPVLRVKFNQIRNQYQCNIYDENSRPLWVRDEADSYEESNTPMSYFKKGMQVATVIECGGVWFMANGKLGVTWRLMQAVTQKPPDTVFSKCLLSLNPEDKKAIQNAVVTDDNEDESAGVNASAGAKASVSTAVEESDEEEEEEEEEEVEEEEEEDPVPEPVKTIKKKVVRAKK